MHSYMQSCGQKCPWPRALFVTNDPDDDHCTCTELDFDMTSLVGTLRGAGHSQISVVQVKHLVRSRRSQWTCSSLIAS